MDNKHFSIVKKGYNIEQVDSEFDDLEAKNRYLTARVNELEQKLDSARKMIKRFSQMENGLRQDIADSKRAAAGMVEDTKARSEKLLDKTRESCGEIISDLDMKISDRMNTMDTIRAEVTAFKDQLFSMYSSHIDLIESIASTVEDFVYEPDYSKVVEAVDEFEEPGAPDCELPEFEEYPQESIFKGFEEEDNKDDFKIAVKLDDIEDKAEEKEFTETVLSEEKEEEDEENEFFSVNQSFIEEMEEEPEEEIQFEAPLVEESEKEPEEEEPMKDDEYYQFLTNFINEDEETLSETDTEE